MQELVKILQTNSFVDRSKSLIYWFAKNYIGIDDDDEIKTRITDGSNDEGIDGIFVKQYSVQIDLKNRVITHDCDDWKKHMKSRLMCKHLGRVFLAIGKVEATAVLRRILSEKDRWTFNAP